MRLCVIVLISFWSVLATAQRPHVINRIEVNLNCARPWPKQVALIRYGEHQGLDILTETDGIYAKDFNEPIRTENLIVSVSLDERRTGCMRNPRFNQNDTGYTAVFRIDCIDGDRWPALQVVPIARNKISYMRVVPADEKKPGSVACGQQRVFHGGAIRSVVPDRESIFLHIGDVNASYSTWHMLIENGQYAKRRIENGTLNLNRDTIAHEYVIRRGRPNARNAAAILKFPSDFDRVTLSRSD